MFDFGVLIDAEGIALRESVLSEIGLASYIIIAISAFLTGLSKTGLAGIGILVVPLLATAVDAKQSVGLLLPMLIFADVFAVIYYRRDAVWWHLVRLLPWAVIGVIAGYLALDRVNSKELEPIIGIIVLSLLSLNWLKNRRKDFFENIPSSWLFACFMGLLAGFLTMLANAAGPVMIIYLLAMGLPKHEFIGTRAWYFLIMNCFKVPFSADLGLINEKTLAIDLMMLPLILLGAFCGVFILNKIPQRTFEIVVQILATAAAIKLLL